MRTDETLRLRLAEARKANLQCATRETHGWMRLSVIQEARRDCAETRANVESARAQVERDRREQEPRR